MSKENQKTTSHLFYLKYYYLLTLPFSGTENI